MSRIKEVRLIGTTISAGTVTINDTNDILGEIVAVAWYDGDLADNITATLSTQGQPGSQTIMAWGAAEADNDKVFYPRHIIHDEGADVLTGTAGGDRALPFAAGKLRLAIVAGGSVKTGGCYVYYRE